MMNLISFEVIDAIMDYLIIFLFFFIVIAFYFLYRSLIILDSLDDEGNEERVNRLLFKIERRLEKIEKKEDENDLKISFIYKHCLETWEEQNDKKRKK